MLELYGTPLFIAEILVLFFISRTTIQEIFRFFSHFTRNRHLVFTLTSLVFFPGTVLHELAHFLMALVLFLRVYEVKVLPEWEGNNIKLGRVLYEKKDFLRGIIVGIAPIIVGLFFFWFIAQWITFFQTNLLLRMFLFYLFFVVSTTMFSSKQDLIDIAFIVPLIIIMGGVLYVLNIPMIDILTRMMTYINPILVTINQYLFYSILTHILLIVTFKGYSKIVRR